MSEIVADGSWLDYLLGGLGLLARAAYNDPLFVLLAVLAIFGLGKLAS